MACRLCVSHQSLLELLHERPFTTDTGVLCLVKLNGQRARHECSWFCLGRPANDREDHFLRGAAFFCSSRKRRLRAKDDDTGIQRSADRLAVVGFLALLVQKRRGAKPAGFDTIPLLVTINDVALSLGKDVDILARDPLVCQAYIRLEALVKVVGRLDDEEKIVDAFDAFGKALTNSLQRRDLEHQVDDHEQRIVALEQRPTTSERADAADTSSDLSPNPRPTTTGDVSAAPSASEPALATGEDEAPETILNAMKMEAARLREQLADAMANAAADAAAAEAARAAQAEAEAEAQAQRARRLEDASSFRAVLDDYQRLRTAHARTRQRTEPIGTLPQHFP